MKITSVLNQLYPGVHVHNSLKSHFGGLWDHGDLQITLVVTYDLKFELSGLNITNATMLV